MTEPGPQQGEWYWFFKEWGKPAKHRPWLIAVPPERFRPGRAFPRTTSDLDRGERREHGRHDHCIASCRLDEDGAIVRVERIVTADDLVGNYSCVESDPEVLRTLEQWSWLWP